VNGTITTINWYSVLTTFLVLNTKIYIEVVNGTNITYDIYYACKNLDTNVKTKVNLDEYDIFDVLSTDQYGGTWG